jgi:putative salt-induced outer membrane protein YdiY
MCPLSALLLALAPSADPLSVSPIPAPREAPAPAAAGPQDDAAPAEETLPKWSGSVAVGATHTSGNSDVQTVSVDTNVERRAEKDRETVHAWWHYGEQDDEISERNAGTTAEYNRFVTEKLYLLANAGVETDSQADLDLRWYAGGGAGYQFLEEPDLTLSGEAGLVYFVEDYSSDPDDAEYVAGRAAYSLGWQLAKTVRFEQDAQAFQGFEDIEDFYGKLDSRLKAHFTETMFGQLQWVWDYDNTPATGKDRSDHRLALALGWSF